jgi:hypothetical protein
VRSQGLVPASDDLPTGPVMKWEWFGYVGSSGNYYNFYLRCCHTHLAALTNDFTGNYAGHTPAQVYYTASQYVAGTPDTWFGFDFDTPFEYDGTNNLIIEVEWNTDGGGYTYCYADATPSHFVYASNGGMPIVSDYFHCQRITIGTTGVAPTSLGRVKSLYH